MTDLYQSGAFQELFGMAEMEAAAALIVETSLKAKSWDCSWGISSFTDKDEQDGFLCLIEYGYLSNRPASAAHGQFVPTRAFIDRVRPRLSAVQSAAVPDVPFWFR
jgi:hypothetical protein